METLEYIQSRKTGALFVVAATLGGTLLGAAPEGLAALKQYAGKLGLAYQIVDDILDAVGDAEVIGKDVRKDVDKASFVTIQGVDAARRSAASLISQARDALTDLDGDTAVLDDIAAYCLDRSH
jgi:geranylgeranyl pyrophosphate synthase